MGSIWGTVAGYQRYWNRVLLVHVVLRDIIMHSLDGYVTSSSLPAPESLQPKGWGGLAGALQRTSALDGIPREGRLGRLSVFGGHEA